VDTNHYAGHPDHLKVFATRDARTKSTIRKALFLDMRLSELMWNEPDRANDSYNAVDRRLGNRVVEFLASISQQPTQAPHCQSTIFRTAFSFSITSVATDVIR